MKSEPIAQCIHYPPHRNFGACVLALNLGHQRASRLSRQRLHHSPALLHDRARQARAPRAFFVTFNEMEEAFSAVMLTAISLYTGAGGLDLGFEAAGFSTRVSVEMDTDARDTIQRNRPEWGLYPEGDIHRIAPPRLLRHGGLQRRKVDVVIAGPPCQPFSKSAFWSSGGTARLSDPRSKTLHAMLDVTETVLPRALVVENVKGVASIANDDVVAFVRKRLESINSRHGTKYKVTLIHLNALHYGVPQARERAFIIAFRNGDIFCAPPPTHGASKTRAGGDPGLEPFRTSWDAIGDLLSVESQDDLRIRGKWAALLPSIPEGHNYLHHTARGRGIPIFGWRTRYWSFLLKLAKDRPSWTLQASPGPATGPFHWNNRLLSIREMCRLQTFPDSYVICGDYRAAQRQLGNAVPPALAEAIARQIRLHLEGATYGRAMSMATGARAGCPPPETPAKAPRCYRKFVGDHAEHPGSGRGPRASQRRLESISVSGAAD